MEQVPWATYARLRRGTVTFVLQALIVLSVYFSFKLDNLSSKYLPVVRPVKSDCQLHIRREPRVPVPHVSQMLYKRIPETFLREFRNPCWRENGTLLCLPYFYQIGSYKCGSTDLWSKLVKHPSVIDVAKEIHWWAWRRFGFTGLPLHKELVLQIRKQTGDKNDHSLQWYFNYVMNQATKKITEDPKLVFGDASVSNFWGLADVRWNKHFNGTKEPPYYLADLIRSLQPNAKITVILRDPVEKMWSTYKLGAVNRMEFPKYFSSRVVKSKKCREMFTEKYCAFVSGREDVTAPYGNVIDQGKYVIFLEEWVRAFGLDKIYVTRLEDWRNNPTAVLGEVIQYLELEPLPTETLTQIVNSTVRNVNPKSSHEPMSNSMRKIIQQYYRPWNIRLSKLLNDSKYTWGY